MTFNAKWPVKFTDKCRARDAHGRCMVVDPGTCNSITRHLTNDECATLPTGCFDTFIKLYSCIQTHRALRMGVYKAGMELEKEAIRQRSRLSESESESEVRDEYLVEGDQIPDPECGKDISWQGGGS